MRTLSVATKNAARRVTDAEVVTLCVAQAIMGIPSDRRFLAVAAKRLGHLFGRLPKQPGYFKRRRRLVDTLEWLMAMFASLSPGSHDDLLLIDSTPVECARSRETAKRSALGDAADYGWCASHSRFFWGFRLHAIFAPEALVAQVNLMTTPTKEKLAEKLARTIYDDIASPLFRAVERLQVFRGLRIAPKVTVDPNDGSFSFGFESGQRAAGSGH